MPGGTIASWAALPSLAWVQIVLTALLDNLLAQDPARAGDVAPVVRYDDTPGFGKQFKLNAERNGDRAAVGIFDGFIHEGLTGNPVADQFRPSRSSRSPSMSRTRARRLVRPGVARRGCRHRRPSRVPEQQQR